MESLEGWHAENVEATLLRRSAAELAGELTYDPGDLSRPAGSLYHRNAILDWVGATTLLTGRPSWLPHRAVLINIGIHDRWGPPLFTMDTNGLASGNTFDEAALHGLYELLERDSCERAACAGDVRILDKDSVTDAGCRSLIEQMQRAGNAVVISDHTIWDGYPCFSVTMRSTSMGVTFTGSGLHHDPAVALSRALTEACQSRLTAISGAREDLPASLYDRFGQWVTALPQPLSGQASCPFPATTISTPSVRQALVTAAEAVLRATGYEPLGVVLDFPAANVPVVRILAPRLNFSGSTHVRATLAAAGT